MPRQSALSSPSGPPAGRAPPFAVPGRRPSLLPTPGPGANRLLASLPAEVRQSWLPHLEMVDLRLGQVLGESGCPLNHLFAQFVVAGDRERWRRQLRQAWRRGGRQGGEFRLQRRDGTSFGAGLDCLLVAAGDAPPSLRITLTDVGARRQVEDALRIAAIAFESQEGMVVTDATGVILRVNRAFTRLTGVSAEAAVGVSADRLGPAAPDAAHGRAFIQDLCRSLQEAGYWQGEVWNRRDNGQLYAVWLTISAVTAPEGATTHYVAAFSEITRHLEAAAAIHRLAHYDALTRLPNRRLLHERMLRAMAASARSGQYGALVFLDLDNFKNLNDSRGHGVGDQLLVEAACRLQACVREDDTVARLGGDEFVAMLENLGSDAAEAALLSGQVGEKIRATLARPYALDGRDFHCPASLGVALFRGREEAADTVLGHADLAMYKAKGAGRNTVRLYDPQMQVALDQRNRTEAELRLALERGQLRLHYQAQIDDARHIIGAEALLRWVHPERGMVGPDDFIPLAEETGLILPIGQWVLDVACAQIKAWSAAAATRELRLAVNVSAHQFRQPGFVAQLRQVLARSGADPLRLKIELTESLVMGDVDVAIDRMQALKSDGIGFAMDDFGTGYSSLSSLKRLPLDQLKIDRAFVRDLASDADDAAIVRTIVTMGRTMGLDVMAEGVETEAQLQCLDDYGCQAFQGYLFARPLPLPAFEALLRRATG